MKFGKIKSFGTLSLSLVVASCMAFSSAHALSEQAEIAIENKADMEKIIRLLPELREDLVSKQLVTKNFIVKRIEITDLEKPGFGRGRAPTCKVSLRVYSNKDRNEPLALPVEYSADTNCRFFKELNL